MKTPKIIYIFAGALALAAIVFACNRRPSGSDAITIGVSLPLTGDAAVYGQALKNGIELARAESATNATPRITLIYEDDQGQAAKSVSAVRKLIDVDHVPAIIGGAMSSTAEAIIPICNQSEVTLLSPTATKPSLTKMGRYFFRLWPSDNYDGKVVAEAAYQKLGYRKVSILFVNVAYGAGIADVFEQEFGALGGKVVSRDGYSQGATDFRSVLTKLQGLNPDAIFVPGYVSEATQILKQARELGIKAKFLGVNSLYDPKLIELAGEAAEGAVFTYPTYDPQSHDPTVANFVTAYKSKYGTEPDAFAAQGYDAFRVTQQAVTKARTNGTSNLNGQRIRDALLQTAGYSGPGGTITFNANGDVEKPLKLLTVSHGKFVPFGDDK